MNPNAGDLKNVPQGLPDAPKKKVMDVAWRGNKAGTVIFRGKPDFKGDKYAERQWIKEHLV